MHSVSITLLMLLAAAPLAAFEKAEADKKFAAFSTAFDETDFATNEKRAEYVWFLRGGDDARDFVKDTYNDTKDPKVRKAALFVFVRGWATRAQGRLDDAETSKDAALQAFAKSLRKYLRGIPEEPPLTVALIQRISTGDRRRFISKLSLAVASRDDALVAAALQRAKQEHSVAFAEKDWPLAVAGALKSSEKSAAAKFEAYLIESKDLIKGGVRDEVIALIGRDIFDPAGAQAAEWAAAEKGADAATKALNAALAAKDVSKAIVIMDAIKRRGQPKLLPAVAPQLDSDNPVIAKAALAVFETHAKSLDADMRDPAACYVWWMMSGRKKF